MAVTPYIEIASVNMQKRNAVTHALLNSAGKTNIILLQEPWYNKIGTARKDLAHEGTDTLGGVASPGWEILYPGVAKDQKPKVMAYAHKQACDNSTPSPFTIMP